jgi:hypothetical protein
MNKFKKGNKVRCTRGSSYYAPYNLVVDATYIIDIVTETHAKVEGNPFEWFLDRFELVELKQEPKVISRERLIRITVEDVTDGTSHPSTSISFVNHTLPVDNIVDVVKVLETLIESHRNYRQQANVGYLKIPSGS